MYRRNQQQRHVEVNLSRSLKFMTDVVKQRATLLKSISSLQGLGKQSKQLDTEALWLATSSDTKNCATRTKVLTTRDLKKLLQKYPWSARRLGRHPEEISTRGHETS